MEFPPYRLDLRAGRLWRNDQAMALRPKAWALLCYLAERPGILVTKDELHAAVWGDIVVSDDTLTRTLGELRQTLGDDAQTPRIIETVHRRGFRFIARLEPSSEDMTAVSPPPPFEPALNLQVGPLVGRDQDLARLGVLFARASAGRRQVVFIEGEPGIGKSVLVEAFLRAVKASRQGTLIGYGQCVEQYGPQEPYMAVLEALERLSQGPSAEMVLSALRSVAPSWLAQMPSLVRPADLERLRRGDADTTPRRMVREFAGLVGAISAERPLVVAARTLPLSI